MPNSAATKTRRCLATAAMTAEWTPSITQRRGPRTHRNTLTAHLPFGSLAAACHPLLAARWVGTAGSSGWGLGLGTVLGAERLCCSSSQAANHYCRPSPAQTRALVYAAAGLDPSTGRFADCSRAGRVRLRAEADAGGGNATTRLAVAWGGRWQSDALDIPDVTA
jgi:hypothetical protein